MSPDDVRAFLRRDWDAVAASKRAYWAERFDADGPSATWEASNALLIDVQQMHADWPTSEQRADDYSHHERVCERLDRAAHAFSRRQATR
jgi:hypothetical protein